MKFTEVTNLQNQKISINANHIVTMFADPENEKRTVIFIAGASGKGNVSADATVQEILQKIRNASDL